MRRRTKTGRIIVLLIILAMIMSLITVPVSGETDKTTVSIDKISYPVLSLTGATGQRMISWWAPADTLQARVYYGTEKNLEEKTAAAAIQSYKVQGAVAGISGFVTYEALMDNLKPDTWYYYQLEISTATGSEKSGISSFYTGNEKDEEQDFSFLYMGDAQPDSQSKDYGADYDQWLDLLKNASMQGENPAFTIMGGDMVNDGQEASEWKTYLQRASTVFSGSPVMSIPGNHECNDGATYKPAMYTKIFAMPQNGPSGFKEEFYSFDYGNCHILALNSDVFEQYANKKITGQQMEDIKQWMKDDLENSNADFNIVVTHHPAYSVTSDTISHQVKENWLPIFQETNVDLILCGHQHVYMRTKALTDEKEDINNGIVSIMGVSGTKMYNAQTSPYAEVILGNTSNYQLITLRGDQLKVTTRDAQGELDQVTLKSKSPKRKQAALDKVKAALGKQKGIKVSSKAYDRAAISWTKNTEADGYEVYRTTGKSYTRIGDIVSAGTTTFCNTKLDTGRTYSYKVRAYKIIDGNRVYSTFSDVKSVKPQLKKTSLTLKAGNGKITARWKKTSGSNGYVLYRSAKKSRGFKKLKTVKKGSITKYTDKKCRRCKKYYYKVRSYRTVKGKKVYSSFSAVKYKKSK